MYRRCCQPRHVHPRQACAAQGCQPALAPCSTCPGIPAEAGLTLQKPLAAMVTSTRAACRSWGGIWLLQALAEESDGGADHQKPDTSTSLGSAPLNWSCLSSPSGPLLLPGPCAPHGFQPVDILALSQALEHKCKKARAGCGSDSLEESWWL